MNDIYYILIPIIASIIGGLIGGLFTFLGVRMTLTYDNKIREEDLKSHMTEQKQKNIEKNKKIIQTRPELTLTDNSGNIKSVAEFCLLPFRNPKLIDKETIVFGYTDEIFNENYWNKYEIILQNTGKRQIQASFLQVPYLYETNIYAKLEIEEWKNSTAKNYFNDIGILHCELLPDEKIKIIIYYPKNYARKPIIPLDLYMHDEDENYWYQSAVNYNRKTESCISAPDTFNMHLKKECNFWNVYDYLFHLNYVEKNFTDNIYKLLEQKKRTNFDRTTKQDQFVCDVNNGKTLLNYKLPLIQNW